MIKNIFFENVINSPEWLKYALIDADNLIRSISKKVSSDNYKSIIKVFRELDLIKGEI